MKNNHLHQAAFYTPACLILMIATFLGIYGLLPNIVSAHSVGCSTNNQAPTITLIGTNPINLTVGDAFVDPGATAQGNNDWSDSGGDHTGAGSDITSKIIVTGAVSTATAGTYTLTYTVTDQCNSSASVSRQVIVAAAPITALVTNTPSVPCTLSAADFYAAKQNGQIVVSPINISSDVKSASFTLTNNTSCTASVSLASYKMFVEVSSPNWLSTQQLFSMTSLTEVLASSTQTLSVQLPTCRSQIDSYFGEAPTALLDSNPYSYSYVPFVLTWAFGQEAFCQNDPGGVDTATNTPPTITILGDNPLTINVNTTFTDPGATATDTQDGNLTSHIIALSTVATTTVGTYSVTYTVTDSGGLTATSTRIVNIVSQPTLPSFCSEATTTLVSGITDQTSGHNAVAVTYHNPSWTASIPGAIWIWSVDPVADPLVYATSTFSRTFILSGVISSGQLEIAADNSFSVSLNGHAIGANPGEFNYATAKQYVIDPSWFVVGSNTLSFTVTNFALPGSTQESNPAGLMYKLTIGPCGVPNDPPITPPVVVNTPPTITVIGDNPLTINVNTIFTDPGATATDAQDGNLTSHIIASSTVATTTVGTYTVTYTVTDSGGLTATSTRTVNVVLPPADPIANTMSVSIDDGNGSGSGGGPNVGFGGGYSAGSGNGNSVGGASSPAFTAADTASGTNAYVACPLLYSYLRYGYNNDPAEVVKLQAFLKRIEGYDVDVNGIFDQKTLIAVNAFQTKYLIAVMNPWGANNSSGYVYITTKKEVNLIACSVAFVITPAEQTIINAYKAGQNALVIPAIIPIQTPPPVGSNQGPVSPTTSPDVGVLNASSSSNIANDNGSAGTLNTASVINASTSVFAHSWNFFTGLFGH